MMHLEHQKNRRPRVRPGLHEENQTQSGLSIYCNGTPSRVWFTKAHVRCVVCWHPLEDPLASGKRENLTRRVRTDISARSGDFADDYDDSVDGIGIAAAQITTLHPYLNLRPEASRKALFRIATLQHTLVALDYHGSPMTLSEANTLDQKIDIETANLISGAIK